MRLTIKLIEENIGKTLSDISHSKILYDPTSQSNRIKSEWLRSKNLQAINAGEGVEKREPSYSIGGNAN